MSDELDEHRLYLSDRHRLDAFEQGIAAGVRPGDVVVDLGCGTGILGLLACRAGAARVYAIDSGGMAEVAESVAAANGFDDRITVIRGSSLDVSLPEPADVVVADQIGGFGFEAGIFEYFADARRRFLKPDGRMIPHSVALFVAPVEAPAIHQEVLFWNSRPAGFDMSPAQSIASNSGYPRHLDAGSLLAPGSLGATRRLADDQTSFGFAIDTRVHRGGVVHGIAGWFTAALAGSVTMTNAPDAARRIQRRPEFFPLPCALPVEPGQTIRIEMQIRPHDLIVKWIVSCGGARFEHCTFKGMLFSRQVLHRTRPEFVPRLSDRGRARKLVLDLAERETTVGEIEHALFESHRQLFADQTDAGRFVAEVITRYAE
ncbi:MAG: 50S ribosomal protein L11 methyltransferase [Acidobacteria bacterium]|nr:50S ribosomal protein L11 methyltransferase [Acidobacteriota bacterium]